MRAAGIVDLATPSGSHRHATGTGERIAILKAENLQLLAQLENLIAKSIALRQEQKQYREAFREIRLESRKRMTTLLGTCFKSDGCANPQTSSEIARSGKL